MGEVTVTYEFTVPLGPGVGCAGIIREAEKAAFALFGDDEFDLAVLVSGRPGAWECRGTAVAVG